MNNQHHHRCHAAALAERWERLFEQHSSPDFDQCADDLRVLLDEPAEAPREQ